MAPVRIYSTDEVSDEQVEELRRRFLEEAQKQKLRGHVHPADLLRARTDTMWLKRFVAHGDLDIQTALDYMVGSVKFRHEWGVNDMSLDSLLEEVPMAFDQGQMSVHARDLDGSSVLVFHAALHQRLTGDDWRRGQMCLVYWVERLEREGRGKPISLFLDMGNAGLQNADIPFIQFMIGIFKNYYPLMLSSIIVFEMPWIMNAVWKIIKQMLPAKAHLILKFTSKKDIGKIIAADNVLERWGGTCSWKWNFQREDHEMPPSPFLRYDDADLQAVEPGGDVSSSDSKSPERLSPSPEALRQQTASLEQSSRTSRTKKQSQKRDRPSWKARSQSTSFLDECARTADKKESHNGGTPWPGSHVSERAEKPNPLLRRSICATFATDLSEANVPAVPVRRRTSRRTSAAAPSPSSTTGLTHYLSILDLPAQGDAENEPNKAPVSDSGDSGASCDDLSDQSQNGTEETAATIGDLLEVCPGEAVQFSNDTTESCRPVTLRCLRRAPVAFKIKTTAPDRFLVRPSRGVVAPGRTAIIELHLAAGVTPQMALSERFLFVAAPVEHAQMTSAELEHVWRTVPASSLQERRLRCGLAPERPLTNLLRGLAQQLDQLQRRLVHQQQLTQRVERNGVSTHRWLVGTVTALVGLAACNVYLLFSGVSACNWGHY